MTNKSVSGNAPWWADARYLAALVLLSAVPLLWPGLPPLTDALGHIARYHVETAIGGSPALQRYFGFDWALIGNLGVDLLIVPLTASFGVELATKLVVLTIPVLTAAGLVLVARQAHKLVTPFVGFALPLAYGYPFQFGFLNYCLSVGLALLAFAGWAALERSGRTRLRAALYVGVGLLLWLCHVFGWALLVMMVVAWGFAARVERGERVHVAAFRAALAAAPLAPPVLLMLAWRTGGATGDTGRWFDLPLKLNWLIAMLRDRWEVFDRLSAALLLFVVAIGAVERRIGYARIPATVAAAAFAVFLGLPFLLLGSAYADMRVAPLAMALAVIGLRAPTDRRHANAIALAALAFFLVRTTATTVSFAQYDRAYRQQLEAVPHIPYGARVIAFAGTRCQSSWGSARMEHLGGIATVRRDAFVNDQWMLRGAQLLTVHHPAAGAFQIDPSQILRSARCHVANEPVADGAIPRFPTAAFDYLWLINLPGAGTLHRPSLQPVWARSDGALYRILSAPSAVASPPLPAHRPASASR